LNDNKVEDVDGTDVELRILVVDCVVDGLRACGTGVTVVGRFEDRVEGGLDDDQIENVDGNVDECSAEELRIRDGDWVIDGLGTVGRFVAGEVCTTGEVEDGGDEGDDSDNDGVGVGTTGVGKIPDDGDGDDGEV
jgi:hypothetical protein